MVKTNEKLKKFQILRITRINLIIGTNKLIGIKIESDKILQDLRILCKLLKISTLVISTNPGLTEQQRAKVEKEEVCEN